MNMVNMAKENSLVLREAAKSAQMGYNDHLSAGGKGDPAEERWIEALNAGADAITHVAVLESRLAQVERERDAMAEFIKNIDPFSFSITPVACRCCKNHDGDYTKNKCSFCQTYGTNMNWEWRGVCEENTKEE